MTLSHWHDRLHEHFSALRSVRKDNPIFALEHDLSVSELAELTRDIRGHISRFAPVDRHWLPWVVYSSEVGYTFSGDEYWQTFAASTPGWLQNGDRYFIRDSFFRFQKEFNGARPSGKWAEAFTIICWPITHAILPRDLQRQLAEILYDIRPLYTLDLLRSPQSLGRQIDAYSSNSNSRFQHLAEEHLLVGQIAAALLGSRDPKDSTLIVPSALDRIARDLAAERSGRQWLVSAQDKAATVRLRGLTREDSDEEDQSESEERQTLVELGIEPRLMLQAVAPDTWDVKLWLPDLRGLVGKFPSFQKVLATQRCAVLGARGGPRATGFLLHGSQEVTLANWPASSETLIKFATPTPELDFLLKTECLLRPGPRWLFKVRIDGTAIEVKTQTMRPGSSYIVLTRNDSGAPHLKIHSLPVSIRCEGVSAVRIDVPDTVSQIFSEQMMALGFRTSVGFQIIPVGMPVAHWDDEGYAEWTTVDSPVLAISAEYEVKGIALNLVGPCGSQLEIPADQIAPTTFVEMGKLSIGKYKLHVLTDTLSARMPRLDATLHITIREPESELASARDSSAVQLVVKPSAISLEQLWDGTASIEILGPTGGKAESRVSFYKSLADGEPTFSRTMPTIELPCSTETWYSKFDAIRGDVRAQNFYSDSIACDILLECEEFGRLYFRCEREFVPLRWILKRENNWYWLRLIQLEEQEFVSVFYCSLEAPCTLIPLRDPVNVGIRIHELGGLYLAEAPHYKCSILVPPQINSLAGLGPKTSPAEQLQREQDINRILKMIEPWTIARTPGDPISRLYKDRVVAAFRDRLTTLLCGEPWLPLEQKVRKFRSGLADLRLLICRNSPNSAFGRVLYDKRLEIAALDSEGTIDLLSDITNDYLDLPTFCYSEGPKIPRQYWIVALAFRLMSEPDTVIAWADFGLRDGLRYLGQNPALARAARFAQLIRETDQFAANRATKV